MAALARLSLRSRTTVDIVAFESDFTNLVSQDNNVTNDVFRRDTVSGTTIRVSVKNTGGQSSATATEPSISSDGRYVAFSSGFIGDLVTGDTNNAEDIFVRDTIGNTTVRASVTSSGVQANSHSYTENQGTLSGDGSLVVYFSYATNLVTPDTNLLSDIFVSGGADSAASAPYTYGDCEDCAFADQGVNLSTGNFTTSATDLALPGRLLGFAFTRWYNSADSSAGSFGPAWTHSFSWALTDSTSTVLLRRGDGSQSVFTKNPDGSYANAPDVFETLVKNGNGTFTLVRKDQSSWEFTSAGVLTRIHEPAGNQILLAYTTGKLTTITDTVSRAITLSYDASNRVTQIQDPAGRKTTYTYDTSGRLSTVTDKVGNTAGETPALHRWTYGYDGSSRRIATITDPDARILVTNTYDGAGRLIQQKDGLNAITTYSYTPDQTVRTDPRLHVTTTTFDARERLLTVSDVVGGTTYAASSVFDTAGNLTGFTDRMGAHWDFTYDTRGNALTATEPQVDVQIPRYETTYVYDLKNNLTQITDAKGFVTTNTFHPTTNVPLSTTREIDATTSATTKYEHGDPTNPGLVTRVISPRGNVTPTPDYAYSAALSYDAAGNLTQTIDADGAKTTHTYDTVGRNLTTVDPDGYAPGGVPSQHTWTTGYSPNDQVTSETNPLSQAVAYGFDGAGNRTTTTDRRGNITAYIYDAASRLWKTRQKPDPTGQPALVYETVVGRDGNGNATSVTQANAVITNYAYDELNRLTTSTVHPSVGVNLNTTLVLNGNGNVITRTTGDGVPTTYTYDALSRLKTVAAPGLATISYEYDELSRRVSMVDAMGTTTYDYDRLSRLTSATQPNGVTTFGYDRDSDRTSVTYPGVGGGTVTYSYSLGGRLDSLTDWASRVSSYTYYASGLVNTISVPGGMTTTNQYDRAQRTTSLTNVVGSTTITSHVYTLDAEGNRTALVEYLDGVTTPSMTESFGFTYDGLNRLKAVTTTNAESFTLDGASNVTARTGPTATYTIDGENRPTSDGTNTLTWSNADRLTSRGSDTFGYDALDRLTSSTIESTSRTYAYSGDGLLQSRTQGTTTSFLWDAGTSPSRLLAEGGDRVIYGLGPLYILEADGTTRALARDGGKSVRAEVNGSGAVTGSWRYRAYGEINQTSGQATPSILGYAGQLLDPSGLYYMRARWYDPSLGRFLTADPAIGEPATPASLNEFTYAHASPTMFTDPSGLCLKCVQIWQEVISPALSRFGERLQRFLPWAQRAETAAERVAPALRNPLVKTLADDVAQATGGRLTEVANGYTVRIAEGSRGIVIRIMESGGGRTNYYRVSIPGKEAFTISGEVSTNRALTHIPIDTDSLNDVLRIVEGIRGIMQ